MGISILYLKSYSLIYQLVQFNMNSIISKDRERVKETSKIDFEGLEVCTEVVETIFLNILYLFV